MKGFVLMSVVCLLFMTISTNNVAEGRPPPCCACVRAPCNCPPCTPWPTYRPPRRYPKWKG